MRKISAKEFTSDCATLLNEVHQTGKPIIITARGQEIARLMPALGAPRKGEFLGHLEGFMEVVGDVESPIEPLEAWDCLK